MLSYSIEGSFRTLKYFNLCVYVLLWGCLIKPAMVCAYVILGRDDRRVGFNLGIACCQNACFVPGCETSVFLCVCRDKTFSTDLWRSILEDSHTGILSFSTVRTQT